MAAHTPSVSDTDSASQNDASLPMPPAGPSDPLLVTSLSVTDWRPQYPRIGQFAMTPSEEVVAATPSGLVYFRRVNDHPSKPWSKPHPFPPTTARLDASSVTGLALYQEANQAEGKLNVYCVAAGKLHAFFRSRYSDPTFTVDPHPPFTADTVSGTPAVASIKEHSKHRGFCVIVPCPSGGILYTSHFYATPNTWNPSYNMSRWKKPPSYNMSSWKKPPSYNMSSWKKPPSYNMSSWEEPSWEDTSQLATQLGIVSAVSILSEIEYRITDIFAVCIARSRLYSIEGSFAESLASSTDRDTWKGTKAIRIEHPGEVTGNPVLLATQNGDLDLLVPSAEGGVFHFVRPAKTPDEWHMIGRIKFPTGIPIASSLAFWRGGQGQSYDYDELRALIQCGGRLYLIQTSASAQPFVGSQLYPVNGPGPFLH